MTTLDLVWPGHRELVGAFPAFEPRRDALSQFRKALAEGFAQLVPSGPTAPVERLAPGANGAPPVRLLVHRPPAAGSALPAILYVHGGGMIAGTADMMAGASGQLAERTGAVVVAVDYRLAPETPFPGGLEDCYAALNWLRAEANELGVDPGRIAIMGDSGGGGLAAATALLARDRGGPGIRAQILLYPMLDDRTGSDRARVNNPVTGEFVWTREQNCFAWDCVSGEASASSALRDYLAPARSPDVSGLPPTFLLVGGLDLFFEEDLAYTSRLSRAGVPIDLSVYAGGVHGFDRLPGDIGERALAETVAVIQRHLRAA